MLKKLILTVITIAIFFAVSMPAVYELFKPGYFTAHDGEGHVIRLEEFDRSLNDGHFPVRMSKNLMYGYGYYFFNFNYPLVYWSSEVFHKLGLDFQDSVKAISVATTVASGLFVYLWLRKHFGNLAGFTAAVFYIYAPYRFLNTYVRGSFAEQLAFAFIPLLFMSVERGYVITGGLAYALLILSHNIMAFIFTILLGLFFFFQFFFKKNYKVLINTFLIGIIGISTTAFFWIPALLEKKFVRLDQTIGQDYPDHFIYPLQLIYSKWGFGASVAGPDDGLSFQIGIFHLIAVALAILIFLKKRLKTPPEIPFYLLVFLISIFFMLPISKPLWDYVPLFSFTQFPWRYLSWSIFAASILAGVVVFVLGKVIKNKTLTVLLTLAISISLIASSHTYWQPNERIHITPLGDKPIQGSTTWAHEQFPIWFEPMPTETPSEWVETYPKANVNITSWKTTRHEYSIIAEEETLVVENTAYYPGWKLFINDDISTINYEHPDYPGRIVYTLQPGNHTIITIFTETPLRKTANIISLFSLAIVTWILLKRI